MTIATIDARGAVLSDDRAAITTMTRFAGLPLLARLVRTAGRLGCSEVHVAVAGDDERAAVERCMKRFPGPDSMPVQVVPEPGAGDLALDPRGVYVVKYVKPALEAGEAVEPSIVVRERADIGKAVRILEGSVKKSVQSDGVISFYLIRPLVIPATRMLLPTPVTANQITMLAMACGIAAAVLAGIGGMTNFVIAGILFWINLVADHVDGQIARLKLKGSRVGEWLDAITDDVTTFALMAGAGIGMYRMGYDPVWMYICVAGAGLGSLVHIKMYYDLHKLGGAIDIADYPWFFGTPSETPDKPEGLIGYGTMIINYLVRRDVFSTALCVALVAFQPIALALILTIRGLTMVPMLLVNEVFKLIRGKS
jgi:phosphatidylglycerophosphate synthase